ncbi:MAG TPA: HAD-IIB family hydrolase, partial [Treponemataceae bacterium]|nr:HAD-IIB family hydrolase [Treponemataceae bacterium]
NNTINKWDKELIQRAWHEKNIMFALVSGRFRAGLTSIADEMQIPCILSCFNGNYVEWQGAVINDVSIDLRIVKDIISLIEEAGLVPVVFDKDTYYVNSHTKWYDKMHSVFNIQGHIASWFSFYTQWHCNNHSVYKVLARDADDNKLRAFEKKLKSLQYPGIETFRSASSILEVLPAGTTKANTLDHLSRYLKIDKTRIMCFGDYMNDYDMIKKCPHGVAMGNALNEVKEVAWYVTRTNDECGIAHALEKFVFFSA